MLSHLKNKKVIHFQGSPFTYQPLYKGEIVGEVDHPYYYNVMQVEVQEILHTECRHSVGDIHEINIDHLNVLTEED